MEDPFAKTNQELLDENSFLKRGITELEQAESTHQRTNGAALLEINERLSLALEVGNAGVWEWYLKRDEVRLDDRFHAMLGYAPGELPTTLQEWLSYHHPEDVPIWMAKAEAYLWGDSPVYESEHRIRTKAGIWNWVFTRGKLVNPTAAGSPEQFIGIAMNVTDCKQTEEALRKSEENFRRFLDDSALGARIVSAAGETIYTNRALLDIYGYKGIEELQNTSTKERYTPESYAEFRSRREKRQRGEFVPSDYEISIVRKDGDVRRLQVFRKEILWNGKPQFQTLCNDITKRKRAEKQLQDTRESLRKAFGATIRVMVSAVESRDPYTAGHQLRSANLARAITTEMGLSPDQIDGIHMAGSIHDIGKLSIPADILSKPTKLSKIEFSLIQEHARQGFEILKGVESPWPLAEMVYQHHERMDGSGYPRHLKGEEILMEARIMAVADVVEAMASHRPYRPALGIDDALAEIEKNKRTLYDNTVVDACLRLFREKGFQLEGQTMP